MGRIGIHPRGIYEFWKNTDITCDNLINFAREHHVSNFKPQTLIVIDESSVFFNPREFGRRDRMQWIYFFANHRHFNFDIILIAQQDRMLDRQIRGLIEYEIKHRSFARANLITMIISKIFRGLYMTIDIWYPCKMKITSNMNRFRKKIGDCYDTMALFIDEPKRENSNKKSGRVVIIDEQNSINDTQQTENDTTTIIDDNIRIDNDTGVAVFDDCENVNQG